MKEIFRFWTLAGLIERNIQMMVSELKKGHYVGHSTGSREHRSEYMLSGT